MDEFKGEASRSDRGDAALANILKAFSCVFPETAGAEPGMRRLSEYLATLLKPGRTSRYWQLTGRFALRSTIRVCDFYASVAERCPPELCSNGLRDPLTPETLANFLLRRWGRDFRSISSVLSELHALPVIPPLARSEVMSWLRLQSCHQSIDREHWERRLNWPNWAEPYIIDLMQYELICRKAEWFEEANHIRSELRTLIDESTLSQLLDLARTGESILFCDAHAGPFYFTEYILNEGLASPPLMPFGSGLSLKVRKRNQTTIDEPTLEFHRVVKHLLQGQQSAKISADGMRGKQPYNIDVLGRTVNLATGSAHAAFYAKCRLVFCAAKWKNAKIAVDFKSDVQLKQGERIGDWTERWMTGYRELLVDTITGEPENIRGLGGIFQQLRSESD